jgi:hypothetical protein
MPIIVMEIEMDIIVEEMQIPAHSIIDTYELWVKMVTGLMRQANELLKNYQAELEKMAGKLRENLSKGECLRKKDFNIMMGDIIAQQKEKGEDVTRAFEMFQQEEEDMIKRLRNILANSNSSTLEDIKVIKEDLLTRQKEREREVVKMLKGFQLEQEELSLVFKKLLSKDEKVMIRDFKSMIKKPLDSPERKDEIFKMLEEFGRVREKVSI